MKNENIFEALRFSESIHEGIPVTLVLHILKRKKVGRRWKNASQFDELDWNAVETVGREQAQESTADFAFETNETPTQLQVTLAKQESVGIYETSFEDELESPGRSVDATPSKPLLRDVTTASAHDVTAELDDAILNLNLFAMRDVSSSRETQV